MFIGLPPHRREEQPAAADATVQRRNCLGAACDSPAATTNITNLVIILGVVIPVVAIVGVLYYLHRRTGRRLRIEDAKDSTTGLDFGLDDGPMKSGRRKNLGAEKGAHKPSQLSMDMNLDSPYLLPPGAHQSQDSIHTLARTFHQHEQDPYRLVKDYVNSEAGSVRSFNPNRDPSALGASRHGSIATHRSFGASVAPPPRTNSIPKSPISPSASEHSKRHNPFATPERPATAHVKEPARQPQPAAVEMANAPYPADAPMNAGPGFDMPQVPSPPATRDGSNTLNTSRSAPLPLAKSNLSHRSQDNVAAGAYAANDGSQPRPDTTAAALGLDKPLPSVASQTSIRGDARAFDSAPAQAGHASQGEYPETRTRQEYDGYEEEPRGRGRRRQVSPDYQQQPQPQQQPRKGLAAPSRKSKRVSVGVRPLPPNEVTDSEDPEYRANRIRSFYKEYFEETKEPAPPMPNHPMPAAEAAYDDYDAGYLGDAAYYDVDTNAFVMPYAQPVTRRAMTPPPSSRSRVGPGGPGGRGPRGPGSIGGMSLPGGVRGRPRAGSAFGPPRPGSSSSAQMRGSSRKRLPPPADLNTLPTPSKLRDDSFALLNAADFAPPNTFRDHVAGRSQSPLGERRPYQPRVPAASPLVTSYDDLAVLPSPHLLRKSATFTNLDFAPPKKFRDADTMSDAGSIRSERSNRSNRSNRSGVSAVQLGAIRSGAGRVSRLPGDTVFTAAAMNNQLKPQWDMNR
ncbi:hypothetical protein DCS_02884 [Drechmeria coniospora]|uniref:Uncharacterized protein n=1 Tax=Drechmeria coniospora TaxID=98403 RepID=A0A151GXE4_DRECN|nr:hypothetical protein DCS_02884 [Drechmeria coniospora]KYK61741.1 hypothetical protein DCS_02884 [Drechmeria coniospora]ODA82545.1 hypothetical protein RJ55_01052 [Drechmeria coniospora]